MSSRWTKMLRDMRATQGRLSTIVVALAVSIAAVATMLSAYTVLIREVSRNYLDTNPASAQLELERAVSDSLLRQVRGRPNIAAAEAAATVLARIEVGPDEWMPLLLFLVPDFDALAINKLNRDSGAWPPPTGAILVERSAMPMTHAALGQSVNVEFRHAGRRSVAIAGTAHDPGVAPAWQEQVVYGYVTPQTLALLGEAVPLNLLKIVVAQGADDAGAIERTTRDLSGWLAATGYAVHEARIPPPKMHPHQTQMNAVLVMLLIFSLLALMLGAVLTATVIGGLLSQQVRQIAIMKAIGARSRQVAGLYLGLVGVLAVTAVALGLPLGIAAGHGFIVVVGDLLNLRIDSFALPWWLFAATLLLGLAAPLITASLPILIAARRTVKEAIDDHGVSPGAMRSSWINRCMARLRLRDATLNLAVRNTFRRRARLILTLTLLAGAGAMFVTSLNLKAAWENNVAQAAQDRHFDAEIYLQQSAPLERVLALVAAMPGVQYIEPWDVAQATIAGNDGVDILRRYPDGAHGGFLLRAAPPATKLVSHTMLAGRWLQAQDSDAVVINTLARTIAFRNARVGDRITLSVDHQPLNVHVVGITRELLTPGAVYVTPATYAGVNHSAGFTNAIRIVLTDHEQAEAASRAIVQALEHEHIGVRAAITEKRFGAAQGGHVAILILALGFIATMTAVVGMLGLVSSLGTSVIERTREFGVMRAVGARSAAVLRTVMGEGLLIGVLSWFVALLLSVPLSAQVGAVLASISAQELSLQLSPFAAVLWLCAVLIGSTIVSFLPAKRASRLTIRQTLAYS